jgi:plasmid stabilization system protein ParE
VIATSIALLRENPELGAVHRAETRRFVLPRFPYSLVDLDDPSSLVFVAVAHHRREPSYWADRV